MTAQAIFLDRDDTLIRDPGYLDDPDQVQLLDGVPEALRTLRVLGYKLVLVTNQSAVARGLITEDQLRAIHDRLEYLLAQHDVSLDRIYYCPHHPDGVVSKYRRASDDRKPQPGMLLRAGRDLDLDLEASWCIGDRDSDIEAGARAGCRTILISVASPVSGNNAAVRPDFVAVNLREAVNIVKQERRRPRPAAAGIAAPPDRGASPAPPRPVPPASPHPGKPRSGKPQHKTPAPPPAAGTRTEHLLQTLLEQVRGLQRRHLYDESTEFSVWRLIAGITQMVVVLCLVLAVWLLLGTNKDYQAVFTTLGFGLVFQVMALTFFVIRDRS